jgi:tRNA A37 threonylcarbamoyladenosine dehydratase
MTRYARTDPLIGPDVRARLARVPIVLVGVGGVGSWCAEALVRTGARRLTLVDDDRVVASNLNRQCEATVETLGRAKVDAMRERLLAIDPDAVIEARCERFTPETAPGLYGAAVVVDAIDSVASKAELLLRATEAGAGVVSSMGAALRSDPTKVVVRRFDKVTGDGLARALRQRFKRLGRWPSAPFPCVCSTELPAPLAERASLMPVTAAFGLALASEVLRIVKCDIIPGNDR